MSLDAFNQIFFWVFVLTSLIFCVLFVWKTYANYRAAESRAAVVINAVILLAIWLAATVVVIVVSAGYFAGHSLEPRTVQLESASVYLISFIIGWILVGTAIIYMLHRSAKHKNYGSN